MAYLGCMRPNNTHQRLKHNSLGTFNLEDAQHVLDLTPTNVTISSYLLNIKRCLKNNLDPKSFGNWMSNVETIVVYDFIKKLKITFTYQKWLFFRFNNVVSSQMSFSPISWWWSRDNQSSLDNLVSLSRNHFP